jgi:hypothetical protein
VVLPADDASRLTPETYQPEAGKEGEAAFGRDAASGFVNDIEVLVEPNRNARTKPQDQSADDLALRLGERARP